MTGWLSVIEDVIAWVRIWCVTFRSFYELGGVTQLEVTRPQQETESPRSRKDGLAVISDVGTGNLRPWYLEVNQMGGSSTVGLPGYLFCTIDI